MPKPDNESLELALVPRVKSFTNQYITKGSYDGLESTINRLSVLVFNSETGNLVYRKEYSEYTSNTAVILNKSMINVESATVVMIANIALTDVKKPKEGAENQYTDLATDNVTLATLGDYTFHYTAANTVIQHPLPTDFSGFPMIGAAKDVNLTSASTDQVVVNLKVLYAKISFNISVANGTENTGTVTPSFTLSNYKVFNASKATPFAYPQTKGEPERDIFGNIVNDGSNDVIATQTSSTVSTDYAYLASTGTQYVENINTTATLGGSNAINFTFYVAESRYNHNSDLTGIYPSDTWLVGASGSSDDDVKGYSLLSDTDKKLPENMLNGVKYFYDDYIQQYKPKLAEVSTGTPATGLATYVLLDGSYTDYRGTVWDVKYKVYLGKDNAQNFHVDRNSEYVNNITIKGIRNNDSYKEYDQYGNLVDQHVWIDHRVNVSLGTQPSGTGSADDCVTITRETLIDSHIEVRPLRVKWEEGRYLSACVFLPRYNNAQITETEDGVNQNWIAIENNDGTRYRDITKYSSNGKRKYFTTDLIEDLHINNTDIETYENEKIISIKSNDCLWIYIDEYTDLDAKSPREAEIELRFYKDKNGNYDSEKYKIIQCSLHDAGGYYIETYEEYLHTYDSEDNYNLDTSPTDYTQQGIVWGLNDDDITNQSILSKNYFTISGFENTWLDGTIISEDSKYKFEFALSEDEAGFRVVDSQKEAKTLEDTGLEFTRRIAVDAQKDVTIADMSQLPESAVQYCLSKNKFYVNPDGQNHHIDIHWYLPAIDEMKTILAAGGETMFPEGNYYWSSQPAYEKVKYQGITGEHYLLIENPNYARATNGVTDAKPTNTTYRTFSIGGLSGNEPQFSEMPGYHSRTKQNRIRCAYSKTGKENAAITSPDGIGPKTIYMRAKRKDTGGNGYFMQYVPPQGTGSPETTQQFTGKDTDFLYPIKGDLADGTFSYDPIMYSAPKKGWITEVTSSTEDPVPGPERFTLGQYPGLSAYVINGPTLERIEWFTGYYTMTEGSNWKSDSKIVKDVKKKIVDYKDLESVSLNKLDGLQGIFSIAFDNGTNSQKSPKYYYEETSSEIEKTWTRHWMVPEYEYDTPTYNETLQNEPFSADNIVGRAGLYEVSAFGYTSWRVATTNAVTQSYQNESEAKEAALNNAITSAKSQVATDIETFRLANNYDLLEDSDIDYQEDEARANVDYDPTNTETTGIMNKKTYYGVSCRVNLSATVTFTKSGKREIWEYKTDTGRWYNESDTEWPNNEEVNDTEWPNFYTYNKSSDSVLHSDELTFYNGNTFTVAVADGYVIGGIKVYFSGSNTFSNNKYLRLVREGYSSNTAHPEGMTFVDGNEGYAEWGTKDGVSSISLQLVECTMTNPGWFAQNVLGQKPTINYTPEVSSANENIIIEKLEITYMKK